MTNSKFKIIYRFLLIGFFAITFHFSLLTFNLAWAASLSLSVSPSVNKIKMEKNEVKDVPIVIKNKTSEKTDLSIYLQAFIPKGNEIKLTDEKLPIFENVKILDNSREVTKLTLGPLEKRKLSIHIDSGSVLEKDYYFLIVFENTLEPVTTTTNALISGGIATNVLLSIGSDTRASGKITEFSTPYFVQSGPILFTTKVTNASNHFITAQGIVFITNNFGQTIGKITIPQTTILANSTKEITKPIVEWPEKFILGRYKATLMLSLYPNGQILTGSTTFLALPYYLILSIILIAISLIIIIKRIKKHV